MFRNKLLHLRRSEDGNTIVEFAVVAPLFFFFIFGAMDLWVYGHNVLSARYLINEFLRTAVTGNARANSDIPDRDPVSRANDIRNTLIQKARIYGIKLDQSNIEICYEGTDATNDSTCDGEFGAGNGTSMIVVRLNYRYSSIFLGLDFPVNVTTIGRNEPF